MKNTVIIISFLALTGIVCLSLSMRSLSHHDNVKSIGQEVVDIPTDVQAVIDKSCVICHNSDSDNAAAKMHIQFDSFKNGDYTPGKIADKMENIIGVIDEGGMPPKRFQTKNPDKILNDNDKKLLRDWAELNLKKLKQE
jgi:hypothetical protein